MDKKSDENYVGKQDVFHINSLPTEQSLNPLKAIGMTQNSTLQRKTQFPFSEASSSVVDRLTNKVTSQENKFQDQQKIIRSVKNLFSWLGMKIRMILFLRHLLQPVKQYFAHTKKLPIESRPLIKNRNNFHFKSNKLSRDSAISEVNSDGKILKLKIPTKVDNKFLNTNKFNTGQRITDVFGISDILTKQRNRRSPDRYLMKDILPRRSSELGDEPKANMLKSLQSSKELFSYKPTSENHIHGLFLDKDFIKSVSYFVNHPDKMSSAKSPGIVGIGKMRPTKPPSMKSTIKVVGNKSLTSNMSRHVASSENEMDIIHEHTKTVESHKFRINTRKHKKYKQKSVNISTGSNAFPYNKQVEMGKDVAHKIRMFSSQTPEVSNKLQTDNQLLRKRSNKTIELYAPGRYHEEHAISDKPHLQQFISNPMRFVEHPHSDDHEIYRSFHPHNSNPFPSLNSINNKSIFEKTQSKVPDSQVHQQDHVNTNIFSKGEISSNNFKITQSHLLHSNVPNTRAKMFPKFYNYKNINMYSPYGEKDWNPQSLNRVFRNPVLHHYGNWRKGRFPAVSAF